MVKYLWQISPEVSLDSSPMRRSSNYLYIVGDAFITLAHIHFNLICLNDDADHEIDIVLPYRGGGDNWQPLDFPTIICS